MLWCKHSFFEALDLLVSFTQAKLEHVGATFTYREADGLRIEDMECHGFLRGEASCYDFCAW